MDLLTVAYYALICCALAGLAPRISGRVRRYVAGAMVGALSALLLPSVRAFIGA
ncbi:MAG: hypothetical protein JJU42_10960 [Rhodobacteraceae bacterium]|nr:hypothetical protein [Paracoccaceae bacterium]